MSEPIDSKTADIIISMFDSFCKTVLRNLSRNIRRRLKKQAQRQVTIPDVQEILYESVYNDQYSTDRFIIQVRDFEIGMYFECVYNALSALPEKQLLVLTLDFWYCWPVKDIANYLEVSEKTVYNLRLRAFKAIRCYYEREQKENPIDV